MSDFSVLGAVSLTLRQILTTNITNSTGTLQGIAIDLRSPKELQVGGQSAVSVWLYKVSRMAEMWNDPPERRGLNQLLRAPLPLELHYLVTPMLQDPVTRHTVLGRVLQVMNDNAILGGSDLQGALAGTPERLRVNLEALTVEELSLVWEALHEPYQLSVTYLVQVAKIDSDLEPLRSSPVLERDVDYVQVVAETGA
jgi:hypothetical protein